MIATSVSLVSRVFVLLLGSVLMSVGIAGQVKDWKGLVPLATTQTDADKWAGKVKTLRTSDRVTYYMSDIRIEIELEVDGFCSTKSSKWNVGKGTIVGVTVSFMPSIPFKNLGFDENLFKAHKYDNDLPGIFLLADVNAGRVLEVEERAGLKDLLVRVARIEPSLQMVGLKCEAGKE